MPVAVPTEWPDTYPGAYDAPTAGVAAIADYLNEAIDAARTAYNAYRVANGYAALTTEQQWNAAYLPKYPRNGWLIYGGGIPNYQIIGPNGLGSFGLHEFQGQAEIRSRIDLVIALWLDSIVGDPPPTPQPPTTTLELHGGRDRYGVEERAALGVGASADIADLHTALTAIDAVRLPVGTLYLSVNSANPVTALGYGTWVAFDPGGLPAGSFWWERTA